MVCSPQETDRYITLRDAKDSTFWKQVLKMSIALSKIFSIISPELNAVSPHTACSLPKTWPWSWFHIRVFDMQLFYTLCKWTEMTLLTLSHFTISMTRSGARAENCSCQLQLILSVRSKSGSKCFCVNIMQTNKITNKPLSLAIFSHIVSSRETS